MIITPTTVEELLDYWPGNIPFKGDLVSEDGTCMCAQGQALHYLGGLTVEDLRSINQREADQRVAELFGISRAHAVLLRIVNDNANGAPACVIRNPEQILGDHAETVLAFWRRLYHTSPATWAAARAATRAAVGAAARAKAMESARMMMMDEKSMVPMMVAKEMVYQEMMHDKDVIGMVEKVTMMKDSDDMMMISGKHVEMATEKMMADPAAMQMLFQELVARHIASKKMKMMM